MIALPLSTFFCSIRLFCFPWIKIHLKTHKRRRREYSHHGVSKYFTGSRKAFVLCFFLFSCQSGNNCSRTSFKEQCVNSFFAEIWSILSVIVVYIKCLLDSELNRSAMAENEETPAKSLSTILKEEPYLCDLHTHLMGMGNANFWIDTILMDEFVMPTNDTFNQKPGIRKASSCLGQRS